MKTQPEYPDLIAQARIADSMCNWQESCRLYIAGATVAQSGAKRAYALNNAAISCRQMGEIDRALRYLIQASHALGDESDAPTRAEIELTIGNTLVDAGDVTGALPHLEAAIRLFRQSVRNEEALNAEIGLGRALAHQGRYEDADRVFSRAISECHTDEVLSQCLNNLAIVRWRLGRHDEAAMTSKETFICAKLAATNEARPLRS